jgi:hypothetical protein
LKSKSIFALLETTPTLCRTGGGAITGKERIDEAINLNNYFNKKGKSKAKPAMT